MSFLTRVQPMLRTRGFAAVAPRAFSTSFVVRKSATEAVKDTVKGVDRAVSDKIVDGIEVGQTATQKVKEAAGMSTNEMKAKANEVAGEAKEKAGEMSGKASELSGEAKGKAAELKGEAVGKKEEIKGKM